MSTNICEVSPHTFKTLSQLYHTSTTLFHSINKITTLFLIITPLIAVYGVCTCVHVWKTWVFAGVLVHIGVLGMSTGYHRLYAHRTYTLTSRPVEVFLLLCATSCLSMSAIDWVKDHRAHHKYTDTDKDPYNIKRGFFWAHIGWLLWDRKMPKSDVSDLKRDPLLRWQHKNFRYLGIFTAWIVPLCICGFFWGDWRGGFFIAAVLKSVVLHHCVFTINSWAHYWGEATFNGDITPRDSLACALWTAGEGYHNFHHEFPNDYRIGVHYSAYDPSKWLIFGLGCVGLAAGLKRTAAEQIKLCRLQMLQKKIEDERKHIFTGIPLSLLPFYTPEQIAKINQEGKRCLVTSGDLVFDVKDFMREHPGGPQYIQTYIGKDIHDAFTGGVYTHSGSARNVLQTLRCGRIQQQ